MHYHIIMNISHQVKREAEAVSKKRSGSRTSKSKTVLETLQEVNVSGLEKLGICNGHNQDENSAAVDGRGEGGHNHHYNVQGRALLTFHQVCSRALFIPLLVRTSIIDC